MPTAQDPNSYYTTPHRRGKHKIFIGMAPGVGKTYKMLEEAHQLKQEGIDVIIGILETHGRKETAQKATGLEMIPKKSSGQGEHDSCRNGYRCYIGSLPPVSVN